MRWFFVLGLSLDLAGAAVIAWTIYSQTAAETREEARARWGGNFWVLLFRLREQAHVRAGMALLATGFTLQLVGYLIGFGWATGLLAGVAAVATAALAVVAARRLADRAVPLRYAQELGLAPGLEDERHIYVLRTLDDVETWRRLYAERFLGKPAETRAERALVQPSGSSVGNR